MTDITHKLKDDIYRTDKPNITFVAGHFPITYDFANKTAKYDLDKWGIVPSATMDVACDLGNYAQSIGKSAKFAIICDDRRYLDEALDTNGIKNEPTWSTSARKRLLKSGLPSALSAIMYSHGFDANCVVKDYSGTDVISEIGLIWRGPTAESVCARAYNSFVGDPRFCNLKTDYIVGMVPEMCANNVCRGVLDMRSDLSSSHIFLPTDETLIRSLKSRYDLFSGKLGDISYRKTGN